MACKVTQSYDHGQFYYLINLVHLQTPPNVPPGEVWRYGYGFPIQVSPTQGAVVANIHRKQVRTEVFSSGPERPEWIF